jgi:hypothetical protein
VDQVGPIIAAELEQAKVRARDHAREARRQRQRAEFWREKYYEATRTENARACARSYARGNMSAKRLKAAA